MNKVIHYILLLGVSQLASSCFNASKSDQSTQNNSTKPNIVFIMADDLGWGDVGCYGQQKITTPNLDRLAAAGMRFTQFYAGSTVCAPSRSSLLTGLHSGHTPIRGNKGVSPEGQWPLPDSSRTLAEMLKEQGYVTGAFGKWGLGPVGSEGDPNKQGFDSFFGYNCQSLAHNYYPDHVWDNDRKVLLHENANGAFGIYAPQLIHAKALDFIEENQDHPFFLYYPTTIPHAELVAPDSILAPFRGIYLPERTYAGVDTGAHFRQGPYASQSECHAAFAAMVTLLDQQVGEIIQTLDQLGLLENTLIFFTSDNGPHLEGGADPDYFDSNGPYRGYKRDVTEGGIRVPMIIRWSGVVPVASQSDEALAFWDLFPTLADLLKTPSSGDGLSFLPLLTGQGSQAAHDYLYWEFHEQNGRVAVREGNWKLIRYNLTTSPQGNWELYDVSTDPGEEHDVAEDHSEIVARLQERIRSSRTDSEVFPLATDQIMKTE